MDHNAQIQRIKEKLLEVRKFDPDFKKTLGAKYHRYRLGAPLADESIAAMEKEMGFQFPEEYRLFLEEIGNGGGADEDQYGAGPCYGLYSLEKICRSVQYAKERYLSPCILYPYIDKNEWKRICQKFEDSNKDADFPFQGMIAIGTSGCTFDIMLVLNDLYRGRIIFVEYECNDVPFFYYEKGFLDWYERWLDEIFAGYTYFSHSFGGDEEFLLKLYADSNELEFKRLVICSFFKFPRLDERTIQFIDAICKSNIPHLKPDAIRVLTRYDYQRAKPYFSSYFSGSDDDKLFGLQTIWWFAREHGADWKETIQDLWLEIESQETYRFASYILDDIDQE